MEGESQTTRLARDSQYLQDGTGNVGGNTYSGPTSTQNLMQQYESLFGPAGRDIKLDSQRNKRHQRWHLPDSLKGYNSFLTDRIDGLITDATKSPFTRNILPYHYLENPDAKIKWNVYSFDEGLASRVPYESAARVLTQSKSSQAGYAVRQGLAIAMEHNFLASAAGRENFKNQLTQLVGSIQMTNDLDVHMALLQAVSYEKKTREKYYGVDYSLRRLGKMYCDLFGIYNKIPNALDLLIEEARTKLKTWGSEPPTFMLCPSNLTLQLTMSPERTDYITNGPDGLKRLAQGPDLPSYRGLSIIYSKKFNLEPGREPRNVLKRKVRVAEYYWLPHDPNQPENTLYEFYDQETDSFKSFQKQHFLRTSNIKTFLDRHAPSTLEETCQWYVWDWDRCDVLLMRPNIEHEMLSVIIGRGGTQELGATFWGQTELACFDDAQHGIWGMSYKYHERAIVTNERNLIRIFDVAFDGYNGGMACDVLQWDDPELRTFKDTVRNTENPFRGKSMLVFAFPTFKIMDEHTKTSHMSTRWIQDAIGAAAGGAPTPAQAQAGIEATAERVVRRNQLVDDYHLYESIVQSIQPKNPTWLKSSKLLLNSVILENVNVLEQLTCFLRYLSCVNNDANRTAMYGDATGPVAPIGGSPFGAGQEMLQDWEWFITQGGGTEYFQINAAEFLRASGADEIKFDFIYDHTGARVATVAGGAAPIIGDALAVAAQLTGIQFTRTMMYSLWKTTKSRFCRQIFEDDSLWTDVALNNTWTMSRFIRYLIAKMIVQYGTDNSLPFANLVASSLSGRNTDNNHELAMKVTEYTQIDVAKFEESILALTQINVGSPSLFAQTFNDFTLDDHFKQFNFISHMKMIKASTTADPQAFAQRNLFLNETMPIYELPNPLIVSNTFETDSTKGIQIDPEGIHNISDTTDFLFWNSYEKSVNPAKTQLMKLYQEHANPLFAQNLSISAFEHIRSNTCDIPALAYHGNMKYTRYDGGNSDIKCIGHLGNSFPGVATVRDGRGVIPANSLSNVFANH
jgi:hypothetical protein